MQLNKIVRSVCYFADTLNDKSLDKLNSIADQLQANGFELQTRRICFTGMSIEQVDAQIDDDSLFISVGMLNREQAHNQIDDFVRAGKHLL